MHRTDEYRQVIGQKYYYDIISKCVIRSFDKMTMAAAYRKDDNLESFSLLWLDAIVHTSEENQEAQKTPSKYSKSS